MQHRAALLILLCLAAPVAAAPYLVKDLNTGPATEPQPIFTGSEPAAAGNVLYFSAGDATHGVELWRSDGTAEGTVRLTDVCPGRCDSNPSEIEVAGGRIFFLADDGVSGRELWQSDGTPGSERRVRDLCPGPCSANPAKLAALDDPLLFLATGADGRQRQLWRSNGARRGTVAVKTVCALEPGLTDCVSFEGLRRAGRFVFFGISAGGAGLDLWRSDGTAAGTQALRDLPGGAAIPPAETLPFSLGSFGIFLTRDAFWRTDGTAEGTSQVAPFGDLVSGGGGPIRTLPLAAWNGALYAAVIPQGRPVVLVRTDGTAAGTTVLHQFPVFTELNLAAATADGVLFVTNNADFNPAVLWRTQGTPETTQQIADLTAQEQFIETLVPLGSRTLFLTSPNLGGQADLWVTDGTPEGTQGILFDLSTAWSGIAAAGDQALFVNGTALWRADGTLSGSREVRDFMAGPGSGGPIAQTAQNGRLLFSAQTSLLEAPLFTSDGTAAGTRVFSAAASWATDFTSVGNRVAFQSFRRVIDSGGSRRLESNGLWWTNGTLPGTVRVTPFLLGFQSPSVLGNLLLFGNNTGLPVFTLTDNELFRSDGTVAGTGLVKNIDLFQIDSGFHHACIGESSSPGPGVAVAGRLLFAANDGVNGRELWSTDGTRAGTRLVRDIHTGRAPGGGDEECNQRTEIGFSSSPEGLVAFRGGVLFTADDGKTGRELWWSNGTSAGTRRVKDLRPGAAGSSPHDLTVINGTAYFFASAAGTGEALWRSDGTAAGTFRVDGLRINDLPSWGRSLTAVGGRLFFSVYNEATGAELWTSRGDAPSTHLVTDLRPGAPGSYPQSFTAVGNLLVFAADDGEHGLEPWRSDGTAAGTRPLGDLNPGLDASSPGPFTRAGNTLFTGADDGEHGRELWGIPVGDL
jgi:ELWxxDGT repeat protein